MRYLRLARARRLLLASLVSSLAFVLFPELDLRLSGLFYDGDGFLQAGRWWTTLLHESVGVFVVGSIATVAGLYAFNRISGRRHCGVDGRVAGYLLLVLFLGSGVIVNGFMKDGFGRARPRNVAQFGGTQSFTPAFVVSDACSTNCSFSSGDASGAFFSLALALAFGRKRATFVAAIAFGSLVSLARVASGAHFLSDTVVSFFVMWFTADVMHFYLLEPGPEIVPAAATAPSAVRIAPAEGFGVATSSVVAGE